jgi:hypothetical protein
MRKTTSLVIVLTLTFGVILASTTSAGSLMVFAQSNQANSSSLSQSSPASPLHIAKIKITSPTRGQQVPVGKDLTISGTSIDNATSNCQVSVIVNKVRPYQPATTATGTGSGAAGAASAADDYSKWNFVLISKYATIKPGQNRITAKYECVNNPDLKSFSSVNVTGVPASATTALPPSSATNQTESSSPLPSTVGANQTAAKQQQPANNTGASSNSTANNPLANILVIGKLFGSK